MSRKGIEKVAAIFLQMQQTRIELLGDIDDHQDLALGGLLGHAKDRMKWDFEKITREKYGDLDMGEEKERRDARLCRK